ncbi:MAG TPA: hypothetical protein PKE04_04580 [Clostridia bacterium]|nr:hypothetical protein [Clostridia bacterium]
MAEMIRFEMVRVPAMRMIGKQVLVKAGDENTVPSLWRRCLMDGSLFTLESMRSWHAASLLVDTTEAYVGWMGNWRSSDVYYYLAGMLMKPNCPVPHGYEAIDLPASEMALGWVRGKQPEVFGQEDALKKRIDQTAYRQGDWGMEVYAWSRFPNRDKNGEVILDLYYAVERQCEYA